MELLKNILKHCRIYMIGSSRYFFVIMPFVEIEKNLEHWKKEILETKSFQELERVKAGLLGKSGIITSAFKSLKEFSNEEKKTHGVTLNNIKTNLENVFAEQVQNLEKIKIEEKLKSETLDITQPVVYEQGGMHLISSAIRDIQEYYHARGFEVIDGPEVETEFHNFDALNIPAHHPARQSQDTFYIKDQEGMLLRTQTSCVQIRVMMERGIPVRMISMGKTYRNDQLDATHSPMFHQMEGLVVDTKPFSIGHLKSELKKFLSFFFKTDEIDIRFRPSFFPFTEPGMEFDCRYVRESGKIKLTKTGDRWLELGGAGMVHPNVFRNCGITEKAYGFAWGLGIDRIVMLKNGISDIRNLFDTDQRWLKYYGKRFA